MTGSGIGIYPAGPEEIAEPDRQASGLCLMALWPMPYGLWPMPYGLWPMPNGLWPDDLMT